MKVRVERCWAGNNRYYFRMTLPDGRRATCNGEDWNRTMARSALDSLETNFNVTRSRVRFHHAN